MNQILSDPASVALIIGFISPNVLALIQRPGFSNFARTAIAFVWSAIAGVATAYFSGEFDGLSIVSTVLLVLVSTVTFYKSFWKPSGVAGAIEYHTTPKSKRDVGVPVGPEQEGPPEVDDEPVLDAPPAVPEDTGK